MAVISLQDLARILASLAVFRTYNVSVDKVVGLEENSNSFVDEPDTKLDQLFALSRDGVVCLHCRVYFRLREL